MPKAAFVLSHDVARQRAIAHVRSAPEGYRVVIDEPRRTSEQERKFHAMLDEFCAQAEHFGKRLSKETWKVLLCVALGHELEYERSLDGSELIAIGKRTSKLTKADYSALIELLYAEGAARGVAFKETRAA